VGERVDQVVTCDIASLFYFRRTNLALACFPFLSYSITSVTPPLQSSFPPLKLQLEHFDHIIWVEFIANIILI
jgi:hypothetical protein